MIRQQMGLEKASREIGIQSYRRKYADAWNAGNIMGEMLGLDDELRLFLANSVAAFYISDPNGNHPSIEDLISFLR